MIATFAPSQNPLLYFKKKHPTEAVSDKSTYFVKLF
jgi:hypothetical protein